MRLVVSYSHGDGYTCSCDENVAFIYESAEALMVDLEAAVMAYRDRDDSISEIYEAHNKKWGPFVKRLQKKQKVSPEEEAEWKLAREDVSRQWTEARERSEVLGDPRGMCLYLNHFLEDGKFVAPYIYTVDEWFATNCGDNACA